MPTGSFADWGLKVGFIGFDVPNQRVNLWDQGTARFAANSLHIIGKALVAILSPEHYEETKNQYVFLSGIDASQVDYLGAFERFTGKKWEINHIDSDSVLERARRGEGDYGGVADLIKAAVFGKYGFGSFKDPWNDRLRLPKEDLESVVKGVAESFVT